MRIDDYKYRFTDQPQGWLGGTVKVDWPILTNLRLDPFERTGMPNGANGSLAFYNWFAYEFWRFVFVQQEVATLAKTAHRVPAHAAGRQLQPRGGEAADREGHGLPDRAMTAWIQREGSPQGPPSRKRCRRLVASGFLVALSLLCGRTGASLAQDGPAPRPAEATAPEVDPPSPWAFRVTPYGWLTWMSGSQTIKGRTADIDTNVFQLLGASQSLIPFMGYFEARFEDCIEVFVDVMYANISAGQSASRNFRVGPFVGGGVTASASENYEQATVQFGGAVQVAKVGRDRSAEAPGMAGVGQTALDVLVGGRYWHLQGRHDAELAGRSAADVGDLELLARAAARGPVAAPGSIRLSASGFVTGWHRDRICSSRPTSAASDRQPNLLAGSGRLQLHVRPHRQRRLGRRAGLPRALCRLHPGFGQHAVRDESAAARAADRTQRAFLVPGSTNGL